MKILFLFLCISPVYIVGMTEEEKLLDAVRNQNISEIKSLIDKVNVNKRSDALWIAISEDNSEIVKLLLAKNADPKAPDGFNDTPFNKAIVEGKLDIVKLFVTTNNVNQELPDGDTPLAAAARVGKSNIVKFFLEQGANINGVNSEGQTPLLAAFFAGDNIEMIKLLIQYGADVNYQMNISGQPYKNMTSLMIAAYYGNVEVVKEFLAANANLLLTTQEGKTAFSIADTKFKDQTTSTENKKKYKEIMDLLEAKEKEIKKMPKTVPSVGQTLFPALQKFTQTLKTMQQVLLKQA